MQIDRLRKSRKSKNKSQQEMAQILGISQPAYATYENGTREPSNEMLNKIAQYFNVSIDYLLGNDNYTPLMHNPQLDKINQIIQESGGELTENELNQIIDYIRYIISKREQPKDINYIPISEPTQTVITYYRSKDNKLAPTKQELTKEQQRKLAEAFDEEK